MRSEQKRRGGRNGNMFRFERKEWKGKRAQLTFSAGDGGQLSRGCRHGETSLIYAQKEDAPWMERSGGNGEEGSSSETAGKDQRSRGGVQKKGVIHYKNLSMSWKKTRSSTGRGEKKAIKLFFFFSRMLYFLDLLQMSWTLIPKSERCATIPACFTSTLLLS